MRYKPKDEIGLVLVGTKKTKNHLAEEYEGEYQNISIVQNIEPVSLQLFQRVESLQNESGQGDIVDAIVVATDMIHERTGTKKYARRIFLVTDAGSPIHFQNDISDIVKSIKARDISINVIGIDFTLSNEKKNDKQKNELLLQKICDQVGGIIIPINQAIETLSLFRSKRVLPRTCFRGCLEIGDTFKIPLWAYKKTDKTFLPSATKLSIHSLKEEGKII